LKKLERPRLLLQKPIIDVSCTDASGGLITSLGPDLVKDFPSAGGQQFESDLFGGGEGLV